MKSDLHLASLSNPVLIPKGRIGRFVYESEIGHGSVGIVYLFRDPLIGRQVAIKVLNPQLSIDQRQLFEKHFIQEARAAGRLNHPNIVTVYDADKTDDLLFIVMERLEGKELSDMLKSGHQFSYRHIADLVGRIANALDYAHEHGVIHRDIKPANIFITEKGAPKVLDFGIASASRQLADADSTLDYDDMLERRLLGTPNYMSPEQAKSIEVDARTDIFSLGVVLYQLLCGQLPFKGKDIPELLRAIINEPAIPPQEIKPDVPLRLARIAAKALAKKPEDRYQSAAEMARDLNRYLEKERTERIIARIQQSDLAKPGSELGAGKLERNVTSAIKLSQRQIAYLGAAVLIVGSLLWLTLKAPKHATEIAVSAPPPIEQTASAVNKTEPVPELAKISEPVVAEAASLPVAAEPPANKQSAAQVKAAATLLAKQNKAKLAATASKPEAPQLSTGAVSIAVSPWGEVYVDGQSRGVAPPLNKLSLPVGKHKIEIKNGDDNYAVTIDVNTEKEIKVAHHF
ncbi:serine/threonine protein kinase [Undibacterium sp. Ren11W]|uniref:serine/threonine protein kinase n=1 Tax=Undibacterium sp. Ren11W TaxID=3413045 RepID=UPI003BF183E4